MKKLSNEKLVERLINLQRENTHAFFRLKKWSDCGETSMLEYWEKQRAILCKRIMYIKELIVFRLDNGC